ncbi:MAG: HD domain-containing protein [Desulfobacterota bacterium]|nr:HD domain-containing protein [Thermodesulfobacteriota bacterium]
MYSLANYVTRRLTKDKILEVLGVKVKGIFISGINKNSEVEGIFLVKEKHMGVTKGGVPYLSLKLMDRTGEINARVWEEAVYYDQIFGQDDFIMVSGYASIYQGGMQLVITNLRKCPEEEIDLEDFLPASPFPIEAMLSELQLIIEDIKDKYLRELLRLFFADKEFLRLFSTAPAAKILHHGYLGGLLEHSLSLARLARMVADNYDDINRDLLLTGAILHDIGKVYEISFQRTFDYTDEGRLLGHIMIGAEMVEKRIDKITGFPLELRMVIKHMILSHHGDYIYGSPKRPKTVEALILYYLDDLDAKVNGFQQFLSKSKTQQSRWSEFHKFFDRFLFKNSYTSTETSDEINSNEEIKE